jgi:Trypsin
MKRLFLAAVVAAVSATAGLHAVTFGQPDGSKHPYVGTIIFQTPTGYFSCSATLMSSTVLLTAGHCTEEGGVANLQTWAKFTPSISFPGRANYATLGDYLNDPANGWIKGTAIPHPQYADFNAFPMTFDVGVVTLNTPVTMNVYGALPPQNFLLTVKPGKQSENRFTVVGYGMQGFIKPFLEDIYARYNGQVKLVETNSTFTGGQSAKFTNNPGTGGGTCFGDSGGPVFYSNTNMVVAVVSWGITPCIGVDYQFRVDTAVAQNFLRTYIP